MHRLPRYIVALMMGMILIMAITVSVSIVSMTRALNQQARESERARVGVAIDNLLGETRVLMLDYAKWEAAVPLIQARDMSWIYDNIGASAIAGSAFQLAILWGGPFASDIGWTEGGPRDPQSDIVDPALVDFVETHLRRIPLNLRRGAEFFAWHEGEIFILAAARIEPDAPAVVADLISRDVDTPRILMGRRLTGKEIAAIADSSLLTRVALLPEQPVGRDVLPLPGGDGQPIAYLAWEAPDPGTDVLRQMLPYFLAVGAVVFGLTLLGTGLARRSAAHLVIAEKQASVAARTDALTGLPNRAAFNEVLTEPALSRERALLFLDVNDFKRINDSIGHAAGDQVIVRVAQRLAILAGPDCFLARIGGDEFVIVVTGPGAEARIKRLAEEAQKTLGRRFQVLGNEMRLKTASGYAVHATDDMTGEDLVRQADLAMYEAKRQKGGGAVAFSALLEQTSREASAIEQELRKALRRPGELAIAYQPIVDMDGHMVRAEALARWTSPELGTVGPDRFISVAEQAGLIVELGWQLFQIVFDDLVAHPDLRVSVNVSPRQLMTPDFVPALVRALQQRGIASQRVEVELTEAVLVDNPRLAAERLVELHAAGLSTAIDDFGTGYSSVSYLEQLEFDTLKIDRSFISKTRGSVKGTTVVEGMITMAHGFDLQVVCEGVETAEELVLMRDLGCDLAQGYHLDRPMAVDALAERWLAPWSRADSSGLKRRSDRAGRG
jgi:diguanylate cyclase (GGDEF)-like protein